MSKLRHRAVFDDAISEKKTKDDGVWDLGDLEEKVFSSSQWGMVGSRAYKGFSSAHKALPPGIYSVTFDRNDDKPVFTRREVKTDNLFHLKESLTHSVLAEISKFWEKRPEFEKLGFLHRRGYLLYGPQGTGKSSVVKEIMNNVVSSGGIVLICDNPKFFNGGLVTLRQIEPTRPIVCVFEDIDAIITRYGDDELLSILDGANMVDYVLNVATTNYPERLDRRIIARPRRFDRVIKVDFPSESVRREFLKAQLPKEKAKVIDNLVAKTDKLSIAALSEVVISVYCLGNSLESTLEILRLLDDGQPSSSEFGTAKIGFDNDTDEF